MKSTFFRLAVRPIFLLGRVSAPRVYPLMFYQLSQLLNHLLPLLIPDTSLLEIVPQPAFIVFEKLALLVIVFLNFLFFLPQIFPFFDEKISLPRKRLFFFLVRQNFSPEISLNFSLKYLFSMKLSFITLYSLLERLYPLIVCLNLHIMLFRDWVFHNLLLRTIFWFLLLGNS